MTATVGFIGVGNMGNPMASNVLKSGVSMTVFDLHAPAMKNLIDAGAKPAASAAEVVERCEIVLTCLPASPDVEAAYLEPGGLVERAKPGNVLVDLSSVLPSTPRKIEPRAKARGVHFLESPVSGGVSGARAGTLALMVGGDPAVLDRKLAANGSPYVVFHVGVLDDRDRLVDDMADRERCDRVAAGALRVRLGLAPALLVRRFKRAQATDLLKNPLSVQLVLQPL
jgi:3-hydroxyisobutyrate dehydrogenase-like beta-hydroxyacid dehydrogenase